MASVRHPSALVALLVALGASGADAADLRVDGLSGRTPDRILVFVARGASVPTPIVAFQERARSAIEEHLYARVISMEEAFVRGGAAFQKQLSECRGEDRCYARLVGSVDAGYLLVVTASKLADELIVGSRFIDLQAATALGNSVDSLASGRDILAELPALIKKSIPEDMWDPFGWLTVTALPDGAQVTVNGRVIGVAPVDRVGHLLPGRYQVTASKPDFDPITTVAAVRRGEEANVGIQLLETPAPSLWWLWVIIGVAAAGGIAAGVAVGVSSRGTEEFCSSPNPDNCP